MATNSKLKLIKRQDLQRPLSIKEFDQNLTDIEEAIATIFDGEDNNVNDEVNDYVVVGKNNELNSDNTFVLGQENNVESVHSIISGTGNELTDSCKTNLIVGYSNKVSKSDSGLVLGSENELTNCTKTLIAGNKIKCSDTKETLVLGENMEVSNSYASIILDYGDLSVSNVNLSVASHCETDGRAYIGYSFASYASIPEGGNVNVSAVLGYEHAENTSPRLNINRSFVADSFQALDCDRSVVISSKNVGAEKSILLEVSGETDNMRYVFNSLIIGGSFKDNGYASCSMLVNDGGVIKGNVSGKVGCLRGSTLKYDFFSPGLLAINHMEVYAGSLNAYYQIGDKGALNIGTITKVTLDNGGSTGLSLIKPFTHEDVMGMSIKVRIFANKSGNTDKNHMSIIEAEIIHVNRNIYLISTNKILNGEGLDISETTNDDGVTNVILTNNTGDSLEIALYNEGVGLPISVSE